MHDKKHMEVFSHLDASCIKFNSCPGQCCIFAKDV